MSSSTHSTTYSSSIDKIDLEITRLYEYLELESTIDSVDDNESENNVTEALKNVVKNREFVEHVNGLDVNVIIAVLGYFNEHSLKSFTSKFTFTIASVLSGKNAEKICKLATFNNDYLIIMVIIRALRKKTFITNIDKISHHPYKMYHFMQSKYVIDKVVLFLEKIYKSEIVLFKKHEDKSKKLLQHKKLPEEIINYISNFTYGESRQKLQTRIKMLFDKLKAIQKQHLEYYNMERLILHLKGNKDNEWFNTFLANKYGHLKSSSRTMPSAISSSLGNRRDIVARNVKTVT